MKHLKITRHAATRMAQRAIRKSDIELAMWLGTEVEGAFWSANGPATRLNYN